METNANLTAIAAVVKRATFILMLSIFTAFTVKAQEVSVETVDETAAVSYLKAEQGEVYFAVKFDNASGGKFDVIVTAASGENLYQSSFSDKKFRKTFRAPVVNGKLIITIRPGKNQPEHKFELASESRLVDQVVVKKQ